MLTWLSHQLPWTRLTQIRESLISKAITAISVSAFLVANFDPVVDALFDRNGDPSRSLMILSGGLVFVVGYLACYLLAPSEFRAGKDIPAIVGDMALVSTRRLFESRVTMFRNAVERAGHRVPDWAVNPAPGIIEEAENSLKNDNWKDEANSFYEADLCLRNYLNLCSRLICAVLFAVGLLLLSVPTLMSLTEIAFRLAGAQGDG